MCSSNWEKVNIAGEEFSLCDKDSSTSISETNENVYLLVFISWWVCFGVGIYIHYFFDVVNYTTTN